MAVIGPWLDLLHVQSWFPTADGGVLGVVQFIAGMFVMGIASHAARVASKTLDDLKKFYLM